MWTVCTATSSAICANRSRRSRSGTENNAPLRGLRVLLTRAPAAGHEASGRLRDLGADVRELPLIRIAPPPDKAALAAAARKHFDWIAFASVQGVHAFVHHVQRPQAMTAKFAAVGPATARAIRTAFGRPVDLIPESHTGGDLGVALAAAVHPGERVLLVQALDARPELLEVLAGAGCDVETVAAYATIEEPPAGLSKAIADADVIVVASGSAVRSLRTGLGDAVQSALSGKTVVCIGPVTADEARHAGIPVTLVPRTYSMAGVIEALIERFGER
jgi:uroporphyrinogen III methyltransferase/synthase